MSLAFAIRDVLQALSGSGLEELGLHCSQEDALGMCPQPRARLRQAEQSPEQSQRPTVYRLSSSVVPAVRSLQFLPALTETLRERARQEKTTVHAALIAAAGIAARLNSDYCPGRDLKVCSTINNRALMGSPEDCGVFFTACDYPIADSPLDDLWDLARKSKHMLTSAQTADGAKAVLGAVDTIVRSGLDAHSAGEEGGK
jgi:hypothetical protein